MEMPTEAELEEAWRRIDVAGPMAPETLGLGILAMKSKRPAESVNRMAKAFAAMLDVPAGDSRIDIIRAQTAGALIAGMNYGLRVGDQRIESVTRARSAPSKALTEVELWAWLGEDDQEEVAKRTGEIGLKQARTPAGLIPMVAVLRRKMEQYWHHAEAQAMRTGKKIRLCRFKFVEAVRETEHGS